MEFWILCLLLCSCPCFILQTPVKLPWITDSAIVVYPARGLAKTPVERLALVEIRLNMLAAQTFGGGRTIMVNSFIEGTKQHSFTLRNVRVTARPVPPFDKSMTGSIRCETGEEGKRYYLTKDVLTKDSRMALRIELDSVVHAAEIAGLRTYQYKIAEFIVSHQSNFFAAGTPTKTIQDVLDMFGDGLLGLEQVAPNGRTYCALTLRIHGWQDAFGKGYLENYDPTDRRGTSSTYIQSNSIVQTPVLLGATRPECSTTFVHPPFGLMDPDAPESDPLYIVPQTVNMVPITEPDAEILRAADGKALLRRITPFDVLRDSIVSVEFDMSALHLGTGMKGFQLFNKATLIKAIIQHMAPVVIAPKHVVEPTIDEADQAARAEAFMTKTQAQTAALRAAPPSQSAPVLATSAPVLTQLAANHLALFAAKPKTQAPDLALCETTAVDPAVGSKRRAAAAALDDEIEASFAPDKHAPRSSKKQEYPPPKHRSMDEAIAEATSKYEKFDADRAARLGRAARSGRNDGLPNYPATKEEFHTRSTRKATAARTPSPAQSQLGEEEAWGGEQ